MIFERSCYDTEDWSNDAENTALHHRNKLHFTIRSHRKHYSQITAVRTTTLALKYVFFIQYILI